MKRQRHRHEKCPSVAGDGQTGGFEGSHDYSTAPQQGQVSTGLNPNCVPQFESIPTALQECPQWIMWRREKRGGRETKVPRTIRGDLARTNDLSTWTTFTDARRTFDAQPDRFDGVGFVVTADSGIVCLDIDACIDGSGQLSANVTEILNHLDTYCEVSPSGHGIRVIAKGTTPESERKTTAIEGAKELIIWSAGRYTTVTGDVHELSGDGIQPRQAQIDRIWQRYFPENKQRNSDMSTIERKSPLLDDDALILRAREAKNGAKFARLFDDGDDDDADSDSEKDYRLAWRLGYWTQDEDQIDRLLRRSALDRDKFDRRDKDGTYLRRTILSALHNRQNDNAELWQGPVYRPDPNQGTTTGGDADAGDDRKPPESVRRSQSSELVDLCDASGVELFHEPGIGGDAFATIFVGRHRETYRLRSREFRRWLGRQFWTAYRKAPSSQATQDALAVLGGKPHFECPEHKAHLRLAGHDGNVYLDLGNEAWEVIEIAPGGWHVIAEPPVRFRRTRGMRALPYPSTDGDIAALRPFLNLGSNDAWVLVVAFLLGTLKPSGPFPILILNGEQGSCKSTASRVLRLLVDPNISDLRATPRDERDLVISANNGWLVVFDNLSHIRTWLSDAMCRLATGGGFSTRELFTDQDEVILDVQRPLVLNGIEELATRGDLVDRAISITLPTIATDQRKTESDFWGAFEQARPQILGGLLDAVSTALQNVGATRLRSLPRMADFATWVVSAESSLPFAAGAFMVAYSANLNSSNATVIEASATGPAIVQLVTTQGHWQGTASELLTALSSNNYTEEKDRKRRDWPDNPRAMSNAVRRLAPTLRAGGIDVDFDREPRSGRRLIILENRCNSSSVSSVASPPAFSGQKQGLWGDDTDATTSPLRHPENGDSESEATIPDAGDATDARIQDSSGGHASDDGGREVVYI